MECSICFDNIFECNSRRLPCNHCFHETCIDNWLVRRHNCPLCRAPVHPRNEGISTEFVLVRLRSIMGDYARATDPGEKDYKRMIIYRMIEKHHLIYDVRVLDALVQHNLPIPEIEPYE